MSNEDRIDWVEVPSAEDLRTAAAGKVHPYVAMLDGNVAHMARLASAHPVIGPALRNLSATVMFGPGSLSRPEREMVAAVAAAAQRCFY